MNGELVLRAPRKDDADAYARYVFDEDILKNLMSGPVDEAEARAELHELIEENEQDGYEHFVIECDGQFAGILSLSDIRFGQARVSYWIAQPYRGRGLATRAVEEASEQAFESGLVRVYGYVRTFNPASARVLEKAGFELEGILRKNKYKDGEYLDDMLYAKVR